MAAPDLLILGGRGEGWHGARLRRAVAAAGLKVERLAFERCGFDPEAAAGLRLSELAELPRAVMVRFIPAGSFEQVTLRLSLLHALEAAGVLVLNPPRAIERCVDKAMASFLLARAGLPTPLAWAVETRTAAEAIVVQETALGHRLVLKPLFGAQGKGLRLIDGAEALPPAEEVAGVWYLQRFVGRYEGGWRDHRVLVAGGEPVAAMIREGRGWITNIRQGGTPVAVAAAGRLAELAVAAAAAVGADHAGVDLIEDGEGGWQVLEVNSMPAWQGLQRVTPFDIAARLAARLARRLGAR